MYRLTLLESIVAAKTFIKRADECLATLDPMKIRINRSKASGAMTRASMELTRKLAELRQGK